MEVCTVIENLSITHITGRRSTVQTGYGGKIVITRGGTATLVIFLHLMKDINLPEETLEVTLGALQVVTKNLTARYSSPSVQCLLVQLVDRIAKGFHTHFMERRGETQLQELICLDGVDVGGTAEGHIDHENRLPAGGDIANPAIGFEHRPPVTDHSCHIKFKEYILWMVQTLLEIIGTVAHPNSISDAKRVVETIRDAYEEFPSVHRDAVFTLRKVIGTHPI